MIGAVKRSNTVAVVRVTLGNMRSISGSCIYFPVFLPGRSPEIFHRQMYCLCCLMDVCECLIVELCMLFLENGRLTRSDAFEPCECKREDKSIVKATNHSVNQFALVSTNVYKPKRNKNQSWKVHKTLHILQL